MKGLPDSEKKRILEIIGKILPKAKVWVFGSRATGKNKPASDVDLCFDNGKKIDMGKFAELRNAFENSDLPYRVDIVDRRAADEGFIKIIDATAVRIV